MIDEDCAKQREIALLFAFPNKISSRLLDIFIRLSPNRDGAFKGDNFAHRLCDKFNGSTEMLPSGYTPNFLPNCIGPRFNVNDAMQSHMFMGNPLIATAMPDRQLQSLNGMGLFSNVREENERSVMVNASNSSGRKHQKVCDEVGVSKMSGNSELRVGTAAKPPRSPVRISTIITNVQRRNVQRTAVLPSRELTLHQLAAQGELLLLETRLRNGNDELRSISVDIKVRVPEISYSALQLQLYLEKIQEVNRIVMQCCEILSQHSEFDITQLILSSKLVAPNFLSVFPSVVQYVLPMSSIRMQLE